MKLDSINSSKEVKSVKFNGRRIFRNNVAQLAKNNPYSLTEPNQRLIANSIAELAKVGDKKNVEFLLNTAAKNKYSTNIKLGDIEPKNPWKNMLLLAAGAAASLVPTILATDFIKESLGVRHANSLNKTEKEILKLREQLLKQVDLEQIKNETKGSIKNFETNLDTFITSSETTQEHKKYVLKRLNYMMSDKYEINPQLADKKSIAVAEMINDMALSTSDNEYPNIKLVNQKQHGMCAAISIVRKKLAYEDKPNYVDSILSELDSSDYILVYDRNALGTGKKSEVNKIKVDFNTALAKGYRIIDASTMHWMQIAQMSGESALAYNEYNPFDKENFDVKTDQFLNVKIDDPRLGKAQSYYQALIMAKSLIEDYKASHIKKEVKANAHKASFNSNLETMGKITTNIKSSLSEINANLSTSDINTLTSELLNLEKPYSNKITEGDKFSYIPNEEEIMKKDKIKAFLESKIGNRAISDEKINNIYSLVDYYNTIVNEQPSSSGKAGILSKYDELYQIAAAFRYQVLMSIEEEQTLDNLMVKENIPSKEVLVIKHIERLINELEKKSPNSELITKQASIAFSDSEILSPEELAGSLRGLKDLLKNNLSTDLDLLYEMLGQENRKQALIGFLDNSLEAISNGDKETLANFSQMLGVKKYAPEVIGAIAELRNKLDNGGEQEYMEVFHKIGNTSQMKYIASLYEYTINEIQKDNNGEFVLKLLNANSLPIEDNEQVFVERLELIENKINAINNLFETCASVLRIVDENGDVLYSAQPKDIIIKKLESDGRIASAKALRELQSHFTKVVEDKSSDEFQSRQGKLKDKSLYNFSPREKATLKETEKNIDVMYSHVKKQLVNISKDMKVELETLKRIIGVNDGQYWVREGGSGLSGEQQIRILEFMTGRPHYETSNMKKAIEKIKQTPYSGISSSSVFHNKPGWHAQYIADIEPVKVKIKDKDGNIKEETKEVLFQDNTWGASEAENTWIDSYGLKRTDYSNNRGGTLGYITNEKFRNGNFVDRIMGDMVYEDEIEQVNSKQYKKIKHPDMDGYKTPQYTRVILDGRSPKTKTVSDKIHDALFVSNENFTGLLRLSASKYTEQELKDKINSLRLAGKSWKPKYEELKRRIFPEFGKGIESETDYNNLANDDYLKVVMEKIALKKRYQVVGLEPQIAEAKTVEDLKKFTKSQKLRAINDFKYAFSKSVKITDYAADSFGDKEWDELNALYEKLNLNLTDEEKTALVGDFEIDTEKFNGSLKTSINLIMASLNKDIEKIVTDKEAAKEISKFFRNYLNKTLYFNKSDLNMYELENQKIKNIVDFIDRVYDPIDDEEFVKIYRKLQDMTEAEFKQEILSKTTDKDLGIKNISGYDILKKIKRHESKANIDFMNEVYYDNIATEIEKESYDPSYRYEKLHRVPKYLTTRTLTSMYRDMSYDLSALNLEKLFNKYKNRNYEKYGVYPAYPKIDILTEEYVEETLGTMFSIYDENTYLINGVATQVENYDISKTLENWKRRVDPYVVIKGEDYKTLTELMGRLVTINLNDKSLESVVESANTALEINEGAYWRNYLPMINHIIDVIESYESSTPEETLEELAFNRKKEIKDSRDAFLKISIQPRYVDTMAESFNKLEKALAKRKLEDVAMLKEQIKKDFVKYHIFNNPEDLLALFIQSCAKKDENKATQGVQLTELSPSLERVLKQALIYAKLYEVQEILMEAVGDGLALNAKTKFNKHFLSDEPMGSDRMIAQMANMLLLDNHMETAVMFLEKLGLNERYVNYIASDLDFDELKKVISEAEAITTNFTKFVNETDPVFNLAKAELGNENPNYEILDGLESLILDAGNRYSIDNECVNALANAVELVKENCLNNKKTARNIIFDTIIPATKREVATKLYDIVKAKQSILEQNSVVIDLANSVRIEIGSDAEQARANLNNEWAKLVAYKDELLNLQNEENSDKI